MNQEYYTMSEDHQKEVDEAVRLCRESKRMTEYGDAYAYPHPFGISWGVNAGPHRSCIARGIIKNG